MPDNEQNVNTKFIATDNVSPTIKAMGASVDGLNAGLTKLDSIGQLVGLTAGIGSVAALGAAVVSMTGKSISSYEEYEEQEVKLITIMHQRMGANAEMVASVNELMEAQGRLGVVGINSQAAGAQQIATFLHSTEAVNTLIPAINDLAVQQHGYNATTEDMTHIANMMGRVLDGNVGALTRVGISLSDQDEQLLKTLPEQEKAALLAQIITNNVGNMNEALAQTPEGRKVQAVNKLKAAWRELGSRLAGIKDSIETELAGGQLNLLEQVGSGIAISFAIVSGGVIHTIEALEWLGNVIYTVASAAMPLIITLGVVYGAFEAATFIVGIYNTGLGMTTAGIWVYCAATSVMSAVTAVKNAVVAAGNAVTMLQAGCTIAATLAMLGLNASMLVIPAIVIGVITVIIGLIGWLSNAADAAGGFKNLFANAWYSAVETVTWAVNKIIDLINTLLGALDTAGSLMNKVFGTSFSTSHKIEHINTEQFAQDTRGAIQSGDWLNFFAPQVPDLSKYLPEVASGGLDDTDMAGNVGDTADKADKIAGNTSRIADKIDMTEEEIKELRDVAQKDVLQNYQNQHIIININNENHIASDVDLTGMTGDLVEGVKEAIATTRKGVPIKGALA